MGFPPAPLIKETSVLFQWVSNGKKVKTTTTSKKKQWEESDILISHSMNTYYVPYIITASTYTMLCAKYCSSMHILTYLTLTTTKLEFCFSIFR